jgi:predicted house-cleaning noncanonical NTP pyrophosphatase (MazG superfamily)
MKCLVFTQTEITAVKENLTEVMEEVKESLGEYHSQLITDALEVIEGGVEQEGFNSDSV